MHFLRWDCVFRGLFPAFPAFSLCQNKFPSQKSGQSDGNVFWQTVIMPKQWERGFNEGLCIEASTYGNPSTLCKKKFLYRMGPVFRASLWPDQWSHRVPRGIKWKVWTLSFNWYPLAFCGSSGLDTTATQSQAFFQKVENAENWPTLLSGETQLFGHFFSNGCHS